MKGNPIGIPRIGLCGESKTKDTGGVITNPQDLFPVDRQRSIQIVGIEICIRAGGDGQLRIGMTGNDNRDTGDLIQTTCGTRLIGRKRAHIPGGIQLDPDGLGARNQPHHLKGILCGCRTDAGAAGCIPVKGDLFLCCFNSTQLPVAGLNVSQNHGRAEEQKQEKRENHHFLHMHRPSSLFRYSV